MKDLLRGYRGPALFAALSFLLIHCSAASQSSFGTSEDAVHDRNERDGDDDTKSSDDDGASTPAVPPVVKKPEPDLEFAFDARALSLQAKVKPAFAKGTLFVDVFPLEHGEAASIDCDSVKQNGQPVDLSEAKGSGSGAYLTIDVPTNALAVTALDGTTRTAVHGCVFDASGKVTTKYATSLMNAWDNDDAVASASPRVFHGIQAYTNGCMDELGELPMFANGEFSCDGEGMSVIPITATDASGNVTTLDETTTNWPLTSAQRAATQRCDRPAWLGYSGDTTDGQTSQCAPFTRIGQYRNSRGTRFIFICRRETVRPLKDKTFENINFIAHNPTSGKTCYFNNHLDGTVTDGSKIPTPDSPTSDVFWMDMGSIVGQRCPSCHDSDPWMHSPWIDGAIDKKTGHTLVPRQGEDPEYNLQTKYSIFGRESFLTSDRQSQTNWKEPTMLTGVGSCGTCHRIGTGMTMQLWSARSVGEQTDGLPLTAAFQTTAKLHWMPADSSAMNKIKACARDPGSCDEQPIPH